MCALADQPQPPPLEEPPEEPEPLDELPDEPLDELPYAPLDDAVELELVTWPPAGLISHHLAPN
jgi:hypothetical protein